MNRAFFPLVASAILLLQLPALAGDAKSPNSSDRMTPQTRLAVMRDLTAERVFVRTVFPRGPRGLELKDGKVTPDGQQVARMVTENGFAAKPGDRVVITNVVIKEKSIVLDLNGGGKQRWHFRDHVELTGSGPVTASGGPLNSGSVSPEGRGSTLFLEFGRKLPDLSPGEVKLKLASVLDFNAQRSAAVHYAESLPPEFQQAIKNRTAAVGMDHEMVLAAMGHPDRKVRERDEDGNETEDWIYGSPPGRTIFVTFAGEKVVRVRQFN